MRTLSYQLEGILINIDLAGSIGEGGEGLVRRTSVVCVVEYI